LGFGGEKGKIEVSNFGVTGLEGTTYMNFNRGCDRSKLWLADTVAKRGFVRDPLVNYYMTWQRPFEGKRVGASSEGSHREPEKKLKDFSPE